MAVSGSFSILEGVMMKVGDRFLGPPKVTLSIDLKPLRLQEHLVDFSLEENIINISKNGVSEEMEVENQEAVEHLTENAIMPKDNAYVIKENCEAGGGNNNFAEDIQWMNEGIRSQPYCLIPETSILEPTPINASQNENVKEEKRTKNFNYSEFEDSNATPFELVELQTLDDIDELKSVLNPNLVLSHNSKATSNRKEIQQKESFPILTNNASKSDSSLIKSGNILPCESGRMKHPPTEGFLSNTSRSYFDASLNNNSCNESYNQTVKQELIAMKDKIDINSQICEDNNLRKNHFTNLSYKESHNSTSNLISSNSKSLPNLVDACVSGSSQRMKSPVRNYEEPPVSTSRIDNIMKKFQFTRLSDSDTKRYDPVAKPSTIKDLRTGGVSVTSLNLPISSNPSVCIAYTPDTTETLSDSSCKKLNTNQPYEKSIKKMNTDDIEGLSLEEMSLVQKFTGMGFPKKRTEKAVKRLQNREKEIIDFLILVQQIADMGYQADDVEIAILNNNPRQVISYLDLVNKWKELGFDTQKIHDALHHTNKEHEAVLEYLTS